MEKKTSFSFDDCDVIEVNKKLFQKKGKKVVGKREKTSLLPPLLPLPKKLLDCQNPFILSCWNLWYFLACVMKRKLKKQHPANYRGCSPLFTLDYQDGNTTLTIHQDWAAKIIGLETKTVFRHTRFLNVYVSLICRIKGLN